MNQIRFENQTFYDQIGQRLKSEERCFGYFKDIQTINANKRLVKFSKHSIQYRHTFIRRS